MAERGEEISDLIVGFDPVTLARLPVHKKAVVDRFLSEGNRAAAKVVAALPEKDGVLDPAAVDRLLIRVHCELQGLSEEFQHGARVAELLRPLLEALRLCKIPPPYRIVDVGCGPGFVVRWLAARGELGADVELVGADYNVALVEEGRRLAALENLKVSFVVANAFRLAEPATIFMTTGVIHHFRGEGLTTFFRNHEHPHTKAFLHFDFQPSPIAPLGAWLFHQARMREPLSLHDGVLSAARSHTAQMLVAAARTGAPDFDSAMYGATLGKTPLPRAFHTILGVRRTLRDEFETALGDRRARLGSWT